MIVCGQLTPNIPFFEINGKTQGPPDIICISWGTVHNERRYPQKMVSKVRLGPSSQKHVLR